MGEVSFPAAFNSQSSLFSRYSKKLLREYCAINNVLSHLGYKKSGGLDVSMICLMLELFKPPFPSCELAECNQRQTADNLRVVQADQL